MGHRKGELRSFGCEDDRRRGGRALGYRVIPAMAVTTAPFALLFDITNFTARRHLAVPTDYAPARQGGEAKQPNQTHDLLSPHRMS